MGDLSITHTYVAAAGVNLFTANVGEICQLTDVGEVNIITASTQEPQGVIINAENANAGRIVVLEWGVTHVRIGAAWDLGTDTNKAMAAADARVDPLALLGDTAAASQNWCCGQIRGYSNQDFADGDTKPFIFAKEQRVSTLT